MATAVIDDRRPARSPVRRAVAGSFIGTAIEWYDFFIYGTAAALVLGPQFFPGSSDLAGTLAAFATLAVGFVARPFGGVIMGHFGDRTGRKSMLVISMFLMGLATVGIRLLPNYDAIHVWVPFLLSIVLVAVALWIRLGVLETPAFQAVTEDHRVTKLPILEVLTTSWR